MTIRVSFAPPGLQDTHLLVTFGVDYANKRVVEAFCSGFRAETSVCAMANDAMVLFSRLLQMGVDVDELASVVGQNRLEGSDIGPPSSLVGAIVREAAKFQRELREGED